MDHENASAKKPYTSPADPVVIGSAVSAANAGDPQSLPDGTGYGPGAATNY